MTFSRRAVIKGAACAALAGPAIAAATPNVDMVSDAEILAQVAPDLRDAAAAMLAAGPPPVLTAASLSELRAKPANAVQPFGLETPVERRAIPGSRGMGEIAVYLINACPGASRPAILHMHGGGFVLGSARKEVPRLQKIAAALDCVILSVEYGLAPETIWSVAIEQNYAGLRWLSEKADALGVDRARLLVMGESAGGGHAALLAFTARDRGEIRLAGQVLVYPMLDDRTVSTAGLPSAVGRLVWTAQANAFGWRSFLGNDAESRRILVRAVPARRADLSGLPPTFIGVGGIDLFAGEDVDFARRLLLAGVPTELVVMPGAFHGFDVAAPSAPTSQQFTAAKIDAIRRMSSSPV